MDHTDSEEYEHTVPEHHVVTAGLVFLPTKSLLSCIWSIYVHVTCYLTCQARFCLPSLRTQGHLLYMGDLITTG